MNQQNIDNLIPVAVEYLSKSQNRVVKDGKVIDSAYSTYLSSFGPTIIQSGMMKALAVYAKEEGDAKRYVIDEFVKKIMINKNVIEGKYDRTDIHLIDIYIDKIKDKNDLDRMEFEDRILETIIACKLALQLFHIEKNKKS